MQYEQLPQPPMFILRLLEIMQCQRHVLRRLMKLSEEQRSVEDCSDLALSIYSALGAFF